MQSPNADDDLEDSGPDLTRDPNWPVRKLAAAVLVQAVRDSRRKSPYYRVDAVRFLYPTPGAARDHLRLIAELAGLSPAWLEECLEHAAIKARYGHA